MSNASEGDLGCSRRTVLNGLSSLLVLSSAGCTHSTTTDTEEPPPGLAVDLSDPANQSLHDVGGSAFVDAPGDTIIVVRQESDRFLALSAICTHQACWVRYQATAPHLRCPCHGAAFRLDGQVARGPARRPLRRYPTEYVDGILYIDT